MNDKQRHALRWIIMQAIDSFNERDHQDESEEETERTDIEAVIELAHPDDHAELIGCMKVEGSY